jgi:hypothetical protein
MGDLSLSAAGTLDPVFQRIRTPADVALLRRYWRAIPGGDDWVLGPLVRDRGSVTLRHLARQCR